MAQGAKPGEGGQLPGHKVYPWIAKVRHSTPGVGLISPPPHHDIYSIEDLAQLIHDLKNANHARAHQRQAGGRGRRRHGRRRRGQGARRRGADQRPRRRHGRLAADQHQARGHPLGAGPGRDAPGAGAQRPAQPHRRRDRRPAQDRPRRRRRRRCWAPRSSASRRRRWWRSGCIMMRVCHLNTCPVGVATQDPELRKKFTGEPGARRSTSCASSPQEVRELMAQLGFRTIDEMVGRTECLEMKPAVDHWKAQRARLLDDPLPARRRRRRSAATAPMAQDHGLDDVARQHDAAAAVPAGARARREGRGDAADPQRQPRRRHDPGQRGDAHATGPTGLPDDTIQLHFTGSAGQSFGAFVPRGHDADAGGRRQRLPRQGAVGRQDDRLPAARRRPSSPRRTSSSATSRSTARPAARRTSAAWPASASASATAASARWSRAWATTAAST